MKLLAVAIGVALLCAAKGARFQFKPCILMDIDGTLTLEAEVNGTAHNVSIDVTKTTPKVSGDCSHPNTTMMTLGFNNVSWVLMFSKKNGHVSLQQSVRFDPHALFNLTQGTVAVTNVKDLELSTSNASYLCNAQEVIAFKPIETNNDTFTASLEISNLHVQAFGLVNNSFSAAEECSADQTSTVTVPTTEPATTAPVPHVNPVKATTFLVKDAKGVPCFRLEAGLQFVVEYNTTKDTMVFSKPIIIDSTNVNGTCAVNGSKKATMVITGKDYTLTITETESNKQASSAVSLKVKLDSSNFPNADKPNTTLTFEHDGSAFQQKSVTTFYMCNTEQSLAFNNSRSELFANNVRLQAFGLSKTGDFTGQGEECSLDPKPTPTPVPKAGKNTYMVNGTNATCIVLTGDISITNVTYKVKTEVVTAVPINIPAMNASTGNVKYSGNCSLEGGNAQQLVITFNTNWTLSLTFARGPQKESSSLTLTKDEYSLRDIEFMYYLTSDYFPNATDAGKEMTAKHMNITSGFLKASTGGGSFLCEDQQTETLDTGAQFETTNLQYKAFNPNNNTAFNGDVAECSADDENNSVIPIAVGAALAGLVVIVLIAYLIGRRRSRRQGYESV